MNPILNDIRLLLVRDLETMTREISMFPDDETIWETPEGITNPAGTLTLHVCGNLKHYVGAVLGGTGYVRNRPAEFSERSSSRQALIDEINETIEIIEDVVPTISESELNSVYPEQVGGFDQNTRLFLIHLCTHLAHHAGQTGYLRRILTGNSNSSGPASVRAIAVTPGNQLKNSPSE